MRVVSLLLKIYVLFQARPGACSNHLSSCVRRDTNMHITFDCTALNLTQIPTPDPRGKIHALHLQFNLIESLRKNDFQEFTDLVALNLRGNRIETIDRAFAELHKLAKLDLSMNKISHLHADDFPANLRWLTVSSNALREIPPEMANIQSLEHLDLSNNKFIKEIPANSFPLSLTNLDMRYTGVKCFSKSSFSNLAALKILLLSDNAASSELRFRRGVFDDLASLEYLDLSRSFCKRLHRNSFKTLTNLRTLRMSNTWLNKLPLFRRNSSRRPDVLSPLQRPVKSIGVTNEKKPSNDTSGFVSGKWYNPKLALLDLSDNRQLVVKASTSFPSCLKELRLRNTNIPKVTRTMFGELISIQKLDLRRSKLRTVALDAFGYLDNVTEIMLSENPIETVPRLPESLLALELGETRIIDLTKKALKGLHNVVEANFRNGAILSVGERAFSDMSSLQTLDLSRNQIKKILKHAIAIGGRSSDSKLLHLNLSSNALRTIENRAFVTHHRLQKLDLHENNLTKLRAETFSGLRSLASLELNENEIFDVDARTFDDLAQLQVLCLQDNKLEVIFSETFEKLSQLRELYLERNRITFLDVVSLPSLVHLDVSQNLLLSFPQVASESVQVIKASHNQIDAILEDSLRNTSNLQMLDISHSVISYVNYSVFLESPKLKRLDLSDNFIENFVDVNLPTLEELLMGENEISSISVSLHRSIPRIKTLDLRYNIIRHLNPHVLFGETNLTRLDLSGNNFVCDCDLLLLANWMKDNVGIVASADLYLCEDPPEEYAMPILDVVSSLDCQEALPREEENRENRETYVAAAVAIGLAFALLLVFLFYVITRRTVFRKSKKTNNNNQQKPPANMEIEDISCTPCQGKPCFSERRRQRGEEQKEANAEEAGKLLTHVMMLPSPEKEADNLL